MTNDNSSDLPQPLLDMIRKVEERYEPGVTSGYVTDNAELMEILSHLSKRVPVGIKGRPYSHGMDYTITIGFSL